MRQHRDVSIVNLAVAFDAALPSSVGVAVVEARFLFDVAWRCQPSSRHFAAAPATASYKATIPAVRGTITIYI
jgi:hypothetical protein